MSANEMTFWDHLEELRWTILRSIIALVVFTIIGFTFMPWLFDHVIMAPCQPDFFLYKYLCKASETLPFIPDFCDDELHIDIINIRLASQFFIHLSTSFWLAIILACPYLLWELWRFVSPALYEHERGKVRWVFAFGTIMFFIGCLVGYCMVFPVTLRFLYTYELSGLINNQLSLDSYMDNFLMLIFIMGVVFEMPLVCLFLSKLGLLRRSFFKKFRRHAVVILLVLAAFITPSGDPFTLMVVFLPLYILYELSAILVKKDDPEESEELRTKSEEMAQSERI